MIWLVTSTDALAMLLATLVSGLSPLTVATLVWTPTVLGVVTSVIVIC